MATGCLSIRQRRQGHLCPATAGIEISGVLEAPRRTSPRRTSGVAGRGISRRRPPGAGSVRQGMDLRAEAVEGGGAVLPSGDPRSTSGHFQVRRSPPPQFFVLRELLARLDR